jgi:hypothetical protein
MPVPERQSDHALQPVDVVARPNVTQANHNDNSAQADVPLL